MIWKVQDLSTKDKKILIANLQKFLINMMKQKADEYATDFVASIESDPFTAKDDKITMTVKYDFSVDTLMIMSSPTVQ